MGGSYRLFHPTRVSWNEFDACSYMGYLPLLRYVHNLSPCLATARSVYNLLIERSSDQTIWMNLFNKQYDGQRNIACSTEASCMKVNHK